MDVKKEFDSFHDFINTDTDSSEIQQTKYCSGKSQTFKNEQDDVLDDTTCNIFKLQTSEQYANDEMIGEIIEYETSKSEQRSDSPTKIVPTMIKQEVENTSDVKVTDAKQEVSEYVQLKTESELSELLTSHCDLPTLKMETSDCLDNNFPSSLLKSTHIEGFAQAHLIDDDDERLSKCNSGEKSFKCDICSKLFIYKHSLQSHLIIHSGEKPFKCGICFKEFNVNSNLQVHLLIHSGEKPFKCDVCSKRFTQKFHLQRHLIIHSGEKPFKCDICFKEFNYKPNLQKHLIIHSDKKPFKCDICFKRFNFKSNLQTHLLIHSDEKPIKCGVCSKRFTQKSDLQRHLKIHSGEKPFMCEICSKEFIQKSSLQTHLLIHSGEKPFKCDVTETFSNSQ